MMFVRRVIVAAFAVAAAGTLDFNIALSQANTKQSISSISNDRLSYELSLTHKILADELFIDGYIDQARSEYAAAKAEAAKISAGALDVRTNERQLLQDEIDYRSLLIDNNLDFWGGAFARQPVNPIAAYLRFGASVDQLSAAINLVDSLLIAASQARGQVDADKIKTMIAQKDADVAALNQEKSIVTQRYDDRQIKTLSDRESDLQKRQAQIGRESEGLRNQLSTAISQENAIVAKAISKAVGLPDLQSLQAVVRGQPLDQTILTIADNLLTNSDSELARSIQEYSKATTEFTEYYKTAKQIAVDVKDAQRAAELFRARSINDIIGVGASIYSNLPPEQQAQLQEFAGSPKLITIVNLANKGANLRNQIADFVSGAIDVQNAASSILGNVVNTHFSDFQDYLSQFLRENVSAITTAPQAQALLDLTARNWPRVLSQELFDSQVAQTLATKMSIQCSDGVDCQNKIAEKLAANGLNALPNFNIDNNRFQIRVAKPGGGSEVLMDVSIADFASRVLKWEMDSPRDQVAARLNDIITQMTAINASFEKKLLANLPNSAFDEQIEQLLGQAARAKGYDTATLAQHILDQGGQSSRTKSVTEIANFLVGEKVSTKSLPPTDPTSSTLFDTATIQSDSSGNPTEAIALQALAMTGPYGAAIAVTVQLVNSMGQVNDLTDRINRLHDEDQQITLELIHLDDLIGQARLSAALADLDDRIASRERDAALEQRNVLQRAFLDAAAEQQTIISRAKEVMPRIWLLSELTRSRFDTLDRSLATWVGNPAGGKNQVEDAIRSNPAWARYALDSDIDLYKWLDRSIEGERTDLDRLNAHWAQLKLLAQQVCIQYKCDGTETAVNSYNVTPEISLIRLLSPSDRDRLRQWQAQTDGAAPSIELPFFVSPSRSELPTHLEGVRFTDLSIAAAPPGSGARYPLDQAELIHSGVGYLKVNDAFYKESFVRKTQSTLQFFDKDADVTAYVRQLQSHWARGELSLQGIEGYPVYSLYILKIFRTQYTTLQNMADIKIRFFYSYRPTVGITSDSAKLLTNYWIQCDGVTGKPVELSVKDAAAAISAKTVLDAGANWSEVKVQGGTNCHFQTRTGE
jgi:hypothetical protein